MTVKRQHALETQAQKLLKPRPGESHTDAWVRAVNAQARYMDEWAASMHPSCWHEVLEEDRYLYHLLASANLPEDQPVQLPLL